MAVTWLDIYERKRFNQTEVIDIGFGENIVVNKLNTYYQRNNIQAYAYRNLQAKFREQPTDICVDSRTNKRFMAIEVKSKRNKKALNFKSDFTINKDNVHQLERQVEFSRLTGRVPFIVLYCRQGRGKKVLIYVFDSKVLLKKMKAGDKSILAREFDEYNIKNELWRIVNK